jgi:hypothetical protein
MMPHVRRGHLQGARDLARRNRAVLFEVGKDFVPGSDQRRKFLSKRYKSSPRREAEVSSTMDDYTHFFIFANIFFHNSID